MNNKGKLVAVYSGKGGVGKTTFTLNLAGTLSNMNKKVLIIDLDLLGGGIAVSLNKTAKKTISDLAKDLVANKDLEINNYLIKYNKNIDFISSPKKILDIKFVNFKAIEKIIFETALLYDVIIFDLNHNYGKLNENVLKLVNKILYIFTNDSLDIKNTSNILPILYKGNNNLKVILNSSIHYDRDYFIHYDIKKIINNNIDYTISKRFHYAAIDSVTIRGEILTLNCQKWYDYKIFSLIAKEIIN